MSSWGIVRLGSISMSSFAAGELREVCAFYLICIKGYLTDSFLLCQAVRNGNTGPPIGFSIIPSTSSSRYVQQHHLHGHN